MRGAAVSFLSIALNTVIKRPSSVVPAQSTSPVIGTNPNVAKAIADYNKLVAQAR